jgi:hypothetical protein
MSKKIFDIVPPFQKKIEKMPKTMAVASRKRIWPFFIIFLFILVSAGMISLSFFSTVEVSVWPKMNNINLEQKILLDLGASGADLEKNIITGEIITNEKSFEKEFSASGKVMEQNKAEGEITVYNEYSDSPRPLVPSRFISADGKLFKSLEKVILPGRKYIKGKLVPGTIKVRVEASEVGEGYNIGSTTFALPALAGSPMYTTIYAKSFSPMAGGFVKEVAQVTGNDLKRAEDSMMNEARAEIEKTITSNLSQDFVLAEGAVVSEIKNSSSSKKIGDISESFNLKIIVSSQAFIFKKSDIQKFIDELIGENVGEDESLDRKNEDISYHISSVDLTSKKANLNLDIKEKVYKKIEVNEIRKGLMGRSINEAKMFLSNFSDIERTELRCKPIMRLNIPNNPDKVEVDIILD